MSPRLPQGAAAMVPISKTKEDYYATSGTNEAPILLARRTFDNTTSPPADSFTTTLPSWFYFADAQYSVVLTNLFSRAGPTGEQVITTGGTSQLITITGI
ncbi:hypothetical protein C8J57DRAFT_1584013 [Mycena rebaudengoi]|nr:hypothetical protein C8J57DRAFT_1584013 [Mycena rebaudengoi]